VNAADKYIMSAGEVAKRLGVSRETVHNYAETGVLSFRPKMRGKLPWKYFNPDEVETYARKRAGEALA
jgi:DNA-binding transcriptional MerR regulator